MGRSDLVIAQAFYFFSSCFFVCRTRLLFLLAFCLFCHTTYSSSSSSRYNNACACIMGGLDGGECTVVQ